MSWQVFVAAIALGAIVLMIAIEIFVQRRRKAPKRRSTGHRHARRQPLLEDRMRDALEAPHAQYGEIFTSYMIWKKENETRMELFTGDPWLNLNAFTRALVVRHLWRALEKLSKGSVVVVDSPPQQWSAEVDRKFDDQGIDPWSDNPVKTSSDSGGPQYIKGP
jgi:hypothetical protein